MLRQLARIAALAALLLAPLSATAEVLVDQCTAQTCKARLTGPELIGEVQQLVAAKRFDEARPMIAALAGVPTFQFEYRFLSGFVAAQTGDLTGAEAMYRAILVDDPMQTRVRLELAKTLFAMGRRQSADRQFRLAAEDKELPADVLRTIRVARDVIRSRRAWTLNMDLGFAPDTNINNATAIDTVTVLFGAQPVPLTLSEDAKARSGTGHFATIDTGLKLPVGKGLSMLADVDAARTEYDGRAFDDFYYEGALGAEGALGPRWRVRLQAVGAQREFGGRIASRQWGVRTGLETDLGETARIGLQLDTRRTTAPFDRGYDGWQTGLYATYERVLARSLIASGGLFARRDQLRTKAYSSVEAGATAGVGGELPLGFNVGVSGSLSRAAFDAPIAFFSPDARRDWRLAARATIGNRAFRWLGFSPSVAVSWGRTASSLGFFATERTRVRFALARYF